MADQQPTTEVQTTENVKGTLGVSFTNPTPMWATWAFRIEFFLNKALLVWVASTSLLTPSEVKEIMLACITLDAAIWGIARSLGIKPPEDTK